VNGLGTLLADVAVITRRHLLRIVRMPRLVAFSLIQPIMFLLLFTYVFGGSMGMAVPPAAGGKYINWLVPGLLIQVAVFGSTQTAVGLSEDLRAGVIDRFRSLPMARAAVLTGRTLSDAVPDAIVVAVMILAGFVLGFRPSEGIPALVGAYLLALAFGFAFSWLMATIGVAAGDSETAQMAAFVPLFPLVFASSVFAPTQTMPDWLRVFADNQPISVVANAIRGLVLGAGALPAGETVGRSVILALVWIIALTAVFAPLSVRIFSRQG